MSTIIDRGNKLTPEEAATLGHLDLAVEAANDVDGIDLQAFRH